MQLILMEQSDPMKSFLERCPEGLAQLNSIMALLSGPVAQSVDPSEVCEENGPLQSSAFSKVWGFPQAFPDYGSERRHDVLMTGG